VEERTSLLNQQGSQHLILCVANEQGRTWILRCGEAVKSQDKM